MALRSAIEEQANVAIASKTVLENRRFKEADAFIDFQSGRTVEKLKAELLRPLE
jgi:cell pole-organizing protein PopZ